MTIRIGAGGVEIALAPPLAPIAPTAETTPAALSVRLARLALEVDEAVARLEAQDLTDGEGLLLSSPALYLGSAVLRLDHLLERLDPTAADA